MPDRRSTDRPDPAHQDRRDRGAVIGAVAITLVLPSVIAWLYFVRLSGGPTGSQQAAYTVGKAVQFGIPLLWWRAVRGEWPRLPVRSGQGMRSGWVSGGAILVVMLGAYVWLGSDGALAGTGRLIHDRLAGFGVASLATLGLLAAFYALVHSFLEEYYWRWFVFGGLRARIGTGPAIILSSVGFMAHHVIVLSVYFGWFSPAALFFSLAVAVGGAVWAWIYHRSDSLAGPWVSHLLVDVAIFAVGFDLVRPMLGQ